MNSMLFCCVKFKYKVSSWTDLTSMQINYLTMTILLRSVFKPTESIIHCYKVNELIYTIKDGATLLNISFCFATFLIY